MRNQDPEASASQLMALEKFLEMHGEDIYDYISKSDYDAIMAKQPSQMQMQMQQQQMQMEAQNTAMQSMAGGGGAPGEAMPMGQQMSGDGTDPMQPQNPNELPVPQSPMGSAVDASIGRAALGQ